MAWLSAPAGGRTTFEESRMSSSNQGISRQPWISGRGFAAMDPERQGEVVGFVRPGPIETSPVSRGVPERAARSSRLDWTRVQPDRDFEGSSSRRGR
jgi:hypothetical protein